jgi:colanic acid/amylovoran biosynthesis protein
MTTKILLINVHSMKNAGDRALLEMARMQLGEAFNLPDFTAVSNFPEEDYFREHKLRVVPSPWWICGRGTNTSKGRQLIQWLQGLVEIWGLRTLSVPAGKPWQALMDAYQQTDLVVGVSGNQVLASGRYGWPFPLTILSVDLAHYFKKAFYTLPQSLGPFYRDWERSWVKSSYGRGRLIFVRDQISLQVMDQLGIPDARLKYAPDPAYLYPAAEKAEGLALLRKWGYQAGQPALGVTVLPMMGRWFDAQTRAIYYASVAAVLKRMHAEFGVQVFLFPQVFGPTQSEDDRQGAKSVIELAGGAASYLHLIDEGISPDRLKACYGQMDLFLASRLHSGIFSLGMGVPTIFIGYLTKTRGMLESLGLPEWMIQMEEIREDNLWQKMEWAWSHLKEMKQELSERLPGICEAARQPAIEIAREYFHHGG